MLKNKDAEKQNGHRSFNSVAIGIVKYECARRNSPEAGGDNIVKPHVQ